MIRIAIGYVAVVVLCAVLILLNPLDFMGRDAREARLDNSPATKPETADAAQTAAAPSSVEATTAAILADLTAAAEAAADAPIAEAPVNPEDEAMRKMSEAVLDGLRGGPAPEASLEGLIAQALAEGQTDQAIDDIVNQAVAEGTVEAPAGLRTTEGKVDTAVLLASILAQAQGEDGAFSQGDLSEPTDVVEGGTLAMQVATEDVLYVVQAGDSLGALALRFYGDAGLFTAIFKANRQVLDTPESLAFGMKLLIPARSGL